MLARHAEYLFWTGRYIERAEDTARLLDVTYHALLEATSFEARRTWRDLLRMLSLESAFAETGREPTAKGVSEFLVLDDTQPGSIVNAVTYARENVRSLREQVSTEMWEAVNGFHLELRARDLHADLEQPYTLYGLVKRRCQHLAGVAAETMPRDDGWRFLQIGWMLERAEMTCRLLDVRYALAVAEDGAYHHWLGILKSASAAEAYRKAHRASLEPADVLEFLLLSRNFPRSLLFCLRRVEQELGRLGGDDGRLTRPERLLGRIRADLEYADVHEVTAAAGSQDLHAFLERMQTGIRQVAEAVALQYFRNSQEVGLTVLDFHPTG
jgi:uncharacterized alpha-E superfamily protein